jgi:hypothetical protein
MSPLTWAMKEVDPVRLHRQPGIHAQDLGIVKILRKTSFLTNVTIYRVQYDIVTYRALYLNFCHI